MTSTHQTAPSLPKYSLSQVAKCAAISGDTLQSSNRVGRPLCCATASASQSES